MSSSIPVVTREELYNNRVKKENSEQINTICSKQAAKRESDRALRKAQQAALMQQNQCDQKIEANCGKLLVI